MFDDLYHEIILEHYRNPRNRGILENPDVQVYGSNTVCAGDELMLSLNVGDGTIQDIAYSSEGCAITLASASIMTQRLRGQTLDEALGQITQVENLMKNGLTSDMEGLEDLEALEGIRNYPARVSCALLGWETLKESVQKYREEHPA